ncbi:hypothetical protein M426DRAFT_20570 [Hypoxylon sp. CI-4A]|nr:hypothetical protein M426DRAFT_20570 [Hypoxylon sp. CI-4A]
MKIQSSLLAALALLNPPILALPQQADTTAVSSPIGFESTATGDAPPKATTADPTETANIAPDTTPAPETSPGFTVHCDYSYCNSGTNVCFYWAGYTSWDVSRGPIPGEVPTMLGPCS